MNKTEKGTSFENYIAFIYEQLLLLDKDNSVVKKNIFLEKDQSKYQIDVYYEFSKANIKHCVAVECKNWEKPVDRKEVAYFESYINHLRNITGVIVSKNGFTSGAKEYALSRGIKLLTLDDLPSFINAIGLNLQKVYFADKNETAEPFYTILWLDNQENWTGEYFIEEYKDLKNTIPLFISKKHAQDYIDLRKNKKIGVRPLKKGHLNYIVNLSLKGLGGLDNLYFSLILFPFVNGSHNSIALKALDFKNEYLT